MCVIEDVTHDIFGPGGISFPCLLVSPIPSAPIPFLFQIMRVVIPSWA